MDTIAKPKTGCTSFHHAVALLVLQYIETIGGPIRLVSKANWPLLNGYFDDRGNTEAVLRRVLVTWPGRGWIEFVPTSSGIDAVWRDSQ